MIKIDKKELIKTIGLFVIAMGLFYVSFAFAAGGSEGISGVADRLVKSFKGIARLITAASFLGGFGFAVASIMKFKAHKDQPQQIPIGTPIALLFISVALLFLPTLFKSIGQTMFGGGSSGTISGVTSLEG